MFCSLTLPNHKAGSLLGSPSCLHFYPLPPVLPIFTVHVARAHTLTRGLRGTATVCRPPQTFYLHLNHFCGPQKQLSSGEWIGSAVLCARVKNAVRVCVRRIQKPVCRVDIGGLSFVVEVWVSGSVIVYGAGLLKDSCFRW